MSDPAIYFALQSRLIDEIETNRDNRHRSGGSGEYPHVADAYTQGLIYLDGFLYESTGITGRSSLRKVRLETGEVIQQRAVNSRDYGEGLTEWRGRLVQLTPRRRGSAPIWHLRTFFEDA